MNLNIIKDDLEARGHISKGTARELLSDLETDPATVISAMVNAGIDVTALLNNGGIPYLAVQNALAYAWRDYRPAPEVERYQPSHFVPVTKIS